jgi:hypothetical protein
MLAKQVKTLTSYVKIAYFCVVVTTLFSGGFFLMAVLDSPLWMMGVVVAAVLASFLTRALALMVLVRVLSDRVVMVDMRPVQSSYERREVIDVV